MEHLIDPLSLRYPQLCLPIESGISATPEYRNAVLRGLGVSMKPSFIGSSDDRLESVSTPAGTVEVLLLSERADFVHAYQALAYKCEPVEIPDSVGAATIKGLINWEKIHRRRAVYLASGGTDWPGEFKRFTADKKNYLDSIILLSAGPYSNLPAERVGLSQREWLERSITIRKYHELTHFVCRTLWSNNVDILRDEIIADMIGLLTAFGTYDTQLAKAFLGIENAAFREGGRLSHYVSADALPRAIQTADTLIREYAQKVRYSENREWFEIILGLFSEM